MIDLSPAQLVWDAIGLGVVGLINPRSAFLGIGFVATISYIWGFHV